jgi:hypothetical protein
VGRVSFMTDPFMRLASEAQLDSRAPRETSGASRGVVVRMRVPKLLTKTQITIVFLLHSLLKEIQEW